MSHAVRSRRRVGFAGPGLLAALLLVPLPSAAAIHTVTNLGDSGGADQIRGLIIAAAAGDTIIVPAGTILLTAGQLLLDKDLVILGAGREFTTVDAGGASRVIKVAGGAHVTLAGLTIRNGLPAAGEGDFVGGGIWNESTLDLLGVGVEASRAEGGGGIWNSPGAFLTLRASVVRGNSTYGITACAGGIGNWGTLTITESTISGNEAAGNSSSAQGGGIQSAGPLTIVNSTISGNRAAANFGGGIHLIPSAASMSLVNVTITDNEANAYGGGLGVGGSSGVNFTLANTIIAGNRARLRRGHADCSGTVTSLGHNLIGSSDGCVIGGDLTGNVLDRDAHLLALAANGGPTETHALRPSSPALDAGDDLLAPAFDQRGVARLPVSDIGAYELVRR